MYPEMMVIPMREELVNAGIKETRTAEEVDAALAELAQPLQAGQDGHELLALEGLLEKVHRAQTRGSHRHLDAGLPRDHHHRRRHARGL